MAKVEQSKGADKSIEEQAAQQAGTAKVKIRVDQTSMETTYANSFRPIPSTEEILLDFGINQSFPSQEEKVSAEIVFGVENRVIMNYYTAKRLAMSLSNIVAQYEGQFGEIELDAAKRRKQ